MSLSMDALKIVRGEAICQLLLYACLLLRVTKRMLALARLFMLLFVLLCPVSAFASCWLYLHCCVNAKIKDVDLVSK